ncbi:MAG: adenosylcobinamide-GDP ribazoletransferase [Bacteroidota bacterium]|nr:adenosylcobinamide-GDP ribazoletransferase [Bacteroidota bacterium]
MKTILYQLAAAISFFTRIPLWRIVDIPVEHYSRIICFWPLTGWITGGITALAWLGFSMFFPPILAIILALTVRLLLTGGFHEDGLGDFFDGFGGGKTKTDILRIMKDSQVGSYALIGMIVYYLFLVNTLVSIPREIIFIVIFVADPFSKLLTAMMMNFLPYARIQSESKSKTLYDKLNVGRFLLACLFGLSPLLFILDKRLWLSVLFPMGLVLFLFFYVKKRIGGYTGDICGATALLCELGFYLSVCLITRNF